MKGVNMAETPQLAKQEPKAEKLELTKAELRNISNLLYTGKWGLSLEENQQVITPLINKLSKMMDQV